MATTAELRKQITATAAKLTGNLPRRGLTNLRKAELEAELGYYTERLDAARAAGGDYESEALREHGLVYDDESGTWVAAGPGRREPQYVDVSTDPREETALDEFAASFEDDEQGPTLDQLTNDELVEFTDSVVDPEFAADVDALVAANIAADVPPARMVERVQAAAAFPITETDVAQAQVDVVVQLKSRLYNGKLIAVVNRRTKFAQPILATVEVGGVRFLVDADHMLAA